VNAIFYPIHIWLWKWRVCNQLICVRTELQEEDALIAHIKTQRNPIDHHTNSIGMYIYNQPAIQFQQGNQH
jgi:hypothetical protein